MKLMKWVVLVYIVGVISFIRCEILTMSAGIGAVGAAYYYGTSYYCKYYECCDDNSVYRQTSALNKLKQRINDDLYGQPLASEIIHILQGFMSRGVYKKALSISIHGWPGTGKNYITSMIADALYKKGMDSQYVKLFIGRYDFPSTGSLEVTQLLLLTKIKDAVKRCPKSLIIFDEINDYVPGLLDIIKPMMDYYSVIDGINYSDVIFIFLSNTKSDEIADRLVQLNKPRSELKMADFEDILRKGSFEAETGGLSKSALIYNQLIDYYIPFLPLEQSHVRKCVIKEFHNYGIRPTEEMVKEVTSVITYGPDNNPIFANAGCKRIRNQVFYIARKFL